MTPEQQQWALDLAVTDGETSKISPEEFLRRFGESDGQALARRLMAEAIAREDADDLELASIVVFTFGVTSELLDPLIQAATKDWHHSHDDVVSLLEELRSPKAVDVLSRLTEWAPVGMEESDAKVLATNATWALAKIGGDEALQALARVRDSNPDKDRRALAAELLSQADPS